MKNNANAFSQQSLSRDPINQAYKDQSDNLYRFLYSMFGSKEEAEDVLQETFVKLYHSFLDGQQIENINPGYTGVAANLSTNTLKRSTWLCKIMNDHPEELMENLVSTQQNPENQFQVIFTMAKTLIHLKQSSPFRASPATSMRFLGKVQVILLIGVETNIQNFKLSWLCHLKGRIRW